MDNIDQLLKDFYDKYGQQPLDNTKLQTIKSTYGNNYDQLLTDLYSKYNQPLDNNKLKLIKDTYKLETPIANTVQPNILNEYIGFLESNGRYNAKNDVYLPKLGRTSKATGKYQHIWDLHKDDIIKTTGIKDRSTYLKTPEAQEAYQQVLNTQYQQALPEYIKIAQNRGLQLDEKELIYIMHHEGVDGGKQFLETGVSKFGSEKAINNRLKAGRRWMEKNGLSIGSLTTNTSDQTNQMESIPNTSLTELINNEAVKLANKKNKEKLDSMGYFERMAYDWNRRSIIGDIMDGNGYGMNKATKSEIEAAKIELLQSGKYGKFKSAEELAAVLDPNYKENIEKANAAGDKVQKSLEDDFNTDAGLFDTNPFGDNRGYRRDGRTGQKQADIIPNFWVGDDVGQYWMGVDKIMTLTEHPLITKNPKKYNYSEQKELNQHLRNIQADISKPQQIKREATTGYINNYLQYAGNRIQAIEKEFTTKYGNLQKLSEEAKLKLQQDPLYQEYQELATGYETEYANLESKNATFKLAEANDNLEKLFNKKEDINHKKNYATLGFLEKSLQNVTSFAKDALTAVARMPGDVAVLAGTGVDTVLDTDLGTTRAIASSRNAGKISTTAIKEGAIPLSVKLDTEDEIYAIYNNKNEIERFTDGKYFTITDDPNSETFKRLVQEEKKSLNSGKPSWGFNTDAFLHGVREPMIDLVPLILGGGIAKTIATKAASVVGKTSRVGNALTKVANSDKFLTFAGSYAGFSGKMMDSAIKEGGLVDSGDIFLATTAKVGLEAVIEAYNPMGGRLFTDKLFSSLSKQQVKQLSKIISEEGVFKALPIISRQFRKEIIENGLGETMEEILATIIEPSVVNNILNNTIGTSYDTSFSVKDVAESALVGMASGFAMGGILESGPTALSAINNPSSVIQESLRAALQNKQIFDKIIEENKNVDLQNASDQDVEKVKAKYDNIKKIMDNAAIYSEKVFKEHPDTGHVPSSGMQTLYSNVAFNKARKENKKYDLEEDVNKNIASIDQDTKKLKELDLFIGAGLDFFNGIADTNKEAKIMSDTELKDNYFTVYNDVKDIVAKIGNKKNSDAQKLALIKAETKLALIKAKNKTENKVNPEVITAAEEVVKVETAAAKQEAKELETKEAVIKGTAKPEQVEAELAKAKQSVDDLFTGQKTLKDNELPDFSIDLVQQLLENTPDMLKGEVSQYIDKKLEAINAQAYRQQVQNFNQQEKTAKPTNSTKLSPDVAFDTRYNNNPELENSEWESFKEAYIRELDKQMNVYDNVGDVNGVMSTLDTIKNIESAVSFKDTYINDAAFREFVDANTNAIASKPNTTITQEQKQAEADKKAKEEAKKAAEIAKKQENIKDVAKDKELYEAARIIVEKQYASQTFLVKELGITNEKAKELLQRLEVVGVIGPHKVGKTRDIYIDSIKEFNILVPPASQSGAANTATANTSGSSVSNIEAKKADIERKNTFTREDLKTIAEKTTVFSKKGDEVLDTKKVESNLSIGDKITFFAEKERKGIWDGKAIRDEKDNPWGLIGILGSTDGWLRNDTKYEAELKAVESLLSKEQTPTALRDVESTAKALEGKNTALIQAPLLDKIAGNAVIGKSAKETIAEEYHKAKADGSNPELVKAVESLLSKEQTPTASDVESTAKVEFTDEQKQEYTQRGFELNDNGIYVHKGTHPAIKKVLNGWVGKLFIANGGTHAGNIHKEGSGIAGSLGKFNFKTGKTSFLDLVFGKDKTDSDYFVTLSHEMGHDIFDKLTPEEKAIIEKNQNLTESAKAHKDNRDNKGELENNASDEEESWSDYVSAFLAKKLFDAASEEYSAIPKDILPILEANVKIPKEVLTELGVESESILSKEQPTSTTQSEIEAKKADIERRRQEELNDRNITENNTDGKWDVAADYLLNSGTNTVLSTDYYLLGVAGAFSKITGIIDNIRNKYAKELADNNLVDLPNAINTKIFDKINSEIRTEIERIYGKEGTEQFDKIIKYPTGLPSRIGNEISSKISKIEDEIDNKINAKYDAELTALEQLVQPTPVQQEQKTPVVSGRIEVTANGFGALSIADNLLVTDYLQAGDPVFYELSAKSTDAKPIIEKVAYYKDKSFGQPVKGAKRIILQEGFGKDEHKLTERFANEIKAGKERIETKATYVKLNKTKELTPDNKKQLSLEEIETIRPYLYVVGKSFNSNDNIILLNSEHDGENFLSISDFISDLKEKNPSLKNFQEVENILRRDDVNGKVVFVKGNTIIPLDTITNKEYEPNKKFIIEFLDRLASEATGMSDWRIDVDGRFLGEAVKKRSDVKDYTNQNSPNFRGRLIEYFASGPQHRQTNPTELLYKIKYNEEEGKSEPVYLTKEQALEELLNIRVNIDHEELRAENSEGLNNILADVIRVPAMPKKGFADLYNVVGLEDVNGGTVSNNNIKLQSEEVVAPKEKETTNKTTIESIKSDEPIARKGSRKRDFKISSTDYTGKVEKAVSYLKTRFEEIGVEVNDEVLRNLVKGTAAEGSKVWGAFHNAMVTLSSLSGEKIGKHEAMHVVFKMFLNKKQQVDILNELWAKHKNDSKYKGKEEQFKKEMEEFLTSDTFDTKQDFKLTDQEQVNFSLKAVNILQSDKAKQVFEKGRKNLWSLDIILTELGIPKEQKQLIQDIHWNILNKARIGIIGDIREEIITDLLANYSYTVEINTAKENHTDEGKDSEEHNNLNVPGGTNYKINVFKTPLIIPSIINHFFHKNQIGWFRSDDKTVEGTFSKETKLDDINIEDVPNSFILGETTYYLQNNSWYMQNQGEEAVNMRSVGLGEPEVLIAYKSKLSGLTNIDNNLTGENYSVKSNTFGTPTKTRRILEVQSDLFQKGRESKVLTSNPAKQKEWNYFTSSDGKKYSILYKEDENGEIRFRFYDGSSTNLIDKKDLPQDVQDFAQKERLRLDNLKTNSDNKFLQLLNKDNNWVTFFIKSIIQDSAKKGYEKVLFPTGNTASKVEGHTTLEEFKKQKEDRIKELEKQKENIKKEKIAFESKLDKVIRFRPENYDSSFDQEYFAKSIEEAKTKDWWVEDYFETKDVTEEFNKTRNEKAKSGTFEKSIEEKDNEITQLKQELERVETEGFGALKPIYNFYENTVTNILKKQGYNPVLITDEYGNTWNELTIDTSRDTSNILLKSSSEQFYSEQSILTQLQEDLSDAFEEYKNNLLLPEGFSKKYPTIAKFIENLFNFLKKNYLIGRSYITNKKSIDQLFYEVENNILGRDFIGRRKKSVRDTFQKALDKLSEENKPDYKISDWTNEEANKFANFLTTNIFTKYLQDVYRNDSINEVLANNKNLSIERVINNFTNKLEKILDDYKNLVVERQELDLLSDEYQILESTLKDIYKQYASKEANKTFKKIVNKKLGNRYAGIVEFDKLEADDLTENDENAKEINQEEESQAESWQTKQGKIDAKTKSSARLREFFSSIPLRTRLLKDGKSERVTITDEDLFTDLYYSGEYIHNKLLLELSDNSSYEDFIKAVNNLVKKHQFGGDILAAIMNLTEEQLIEAYDNNTLELPLDIFTNLEAYGDYKLWILKDMYYAIGDQSNLQPIKTLTKNKGEQTTDAQIGLSVQDTDYDNAARTIKESVDTILTDPSKRESFKTLLDQTITAINEKDKVAGLIIKVFGKMGYQVSDELLLNLQPTSSINGEEDNLTYLKKGLVSIVNDINDNNKTTIDPTGRGVDIPAKLISTYSTVSSGLSYMNVEGENEFAHQNSNHLSRTGAIWAKGADAMKQWVNNMRYVDGDPNKAIVLQSYLPMYNDMLDSTNTFRIYQDGGTQVEGQTNSGKAYADMTSAELTAHSINLYLTKNNIKNAGNTIKKLHALFHVMVFSDSPKRQMLHAPTYNGDTGHNRIIDKLINIVYGELERVGYAKAQENTSISELEKLSVAGKLIHTIPQLNDVKIKYNDKYIPFAEFFATNLWTNPNSAIQISNATTYKGIDKQGNAFESPLNGNTHRAMVSQIIKETLAKDYQHYIDTIYTSDVKKLVTSSATDNDIKDFYYNSYYYNISAGIMFSGDPAHYKLKNDSTNIERVKRDKQNVAPNIHLAFEKPTYDVIILKDVKANTSNVGNKEVAADLADASAWHTLERRIEILKASPNWELIKNELLPALEAIQNNKYTQKDLQTVHLQIIKPFVYAQVNKELPVGEGVTAYFKLPIQLKNSEAVLLPTEAYRVYGNSESYVRPESLADITADKYYSPELARTLFLMEKTNVGTVVFESGSKGEIFGKVNLETYTEADIISMNTDEARATTILTLKNADWGLQMEVPRKDLQAKVGQGSQEHKIMSANVDEDWVFTVGSQTFSGQQGANNLLQEIQAIFAKENLTKLKKEITNEDSSLNVKEVLDIVTDTLIEKFTNIDTIEGLELQTDGKTLTPLELFGKKAEKVLNSLFKAVSKIKGSGAALVNKTSVGYIHDVEFDKDKGEISLSNDLKLVRDKDGNILHYEAIVPVYDPIIYQFIDNNGELLLDEDNNPLIPEKLLYAFFYRIPTEDKYSMFPIKIKKFSMPVEGGGIILPREATQTAGLDFDIDKLYGYYYNFKVNYPPEFRNFVINKFNKSTGLDSAKYFDALEDNTITLDFTDTELVIVNILKNSIEAYKKDYEKLNNKFLTNTKDFIKLIEPNLKNSKSAHNLKLDVYFSLVNTKAYTRDALTPGNKDRLEALRDELVGSQYQAKYSYGDPSFIAKSANKNIVGKRLIGIFANANSFYNLIQGAAKITLKNPIEFIANGVKYSFDSIGGINHQISKNIAELLFASTEDVKDPVLELLNINTHTAPLLVTLLSMTNGTDIIKFEDAVKLLSDKSIIDAVKKAESENKKFTNVYPKDGKYHKLIQMSEKYNAIVSASKIDQAIGPDFFTVQSKLSNIDNIITDSIDTRNYPFTSESVKSILPSSTNTSNIKQLNVYREALDLELELFKDVFSFLKDKVLSTLDILEGRSKTGKLAPAKKYDIAYYMYDAAIQNLYGETVVKELTENFPTKLFNYNYPGNTGILKQAFEIDKKGIVKMKWVNTNATNILEQYKEAFSDLFTLDPTMAEELAKYAFLTGTKFKMDSIVKIVPNEFYKEGVGKKIRDIINGNTLEDNLLENIADVIMVNHYKLILPKEEMIINGNTATLKNESFSDPKPFLWSDQGTVDFIYEHTGDSIYKYYAVEKTKFPNYLINVKKNTTFAVNNNMVKEKHNIETSTTVDKTLSWKELLSLPVYSNKGVNTMRTKVGNPNEHFGNPFTGTGVAGLIQMPDIPSAVEAYKQWLKTETIGLTSDFSRQSVEQDSEYLYLFTDNAERTSGSSPVDNDSWYAQTYGEGKNYAGQTQAVIRGLNNAFPITTMVNDKRVQWKDSQFEQYKAIIDQEIEQIKDAINQGQFKGVKFSAKMPFGQGAISKMKSESPKIFNYMTLKLAEIGIDNRGDKPISVKPEQRQWILSEIEQGKLDGQQLLYMNDKGEYYSHADALAGIINNTTDSESNINNPQDFKNYSGGALGADKFWEKVAKEYNIGEQVNFTPNDLKRLTLEQREKVESAYQQAVQDLGRRPLPYNWENPQKEDYAGGLVRRDYLQAVFADAIFAVSTIVQPGQKDPKGYINKKSLPIVSGGTGYAVQMGINLGKPAYVFDQQQNKWFMWKDDNFVEISIPKLTKNFAGIGTRELSDIGKKAIEDVFLNTFNNTLDEPDINNNNITEC